MAKVNIKNTNRQRRRLKIRETVSGTSQRPRISVFRSNKYTYAQLIDDVKGSTIASVFAEVEELHKGKNKTEAAFEVGKLLAEKAKKLKIEKAVFDRSGYRYHGRVKSIADGVREGGITL